LQPASENGPTGQVFKHLRREHVSIARDRRRLGDDELFAEPKRAAAGMPQAVIRVN
jgi:hypothetical protein